MINGDKFYRFRSFWDWNNERFGSEMEDILENKLTFVNPKLFNDPFELKMHKFESDFGKIIHGNFIAVFQSIYSWVKAIDMEVEYMTNVFAVKVDPDIATCNDIPKMNNKTLDYLYRRVIDDLRSKNRNLVELLSFSHITYFVHLYNTLFFKEESIKLCCLTKELLSIYYWSHYGGSHNGYAIEYSFDPSFRSDKTGHFYPLPVIYLDSKKDLENLEKDTIFSPILLKSKDWSVEQEHRIFIRSNSNTDYEKIPLNSLTQEKITGIYLGMRFNKTSDKAKEFLEIVRKKDTPIFQIERNNQNFILNIKRI